MLATVTVSVASLLGIMFFCFVVSGVVAFFVFDWVLERCLENAKEEWTALASEIVERTRGEVKC